MTPTEKIIYSLIAFLPLLIMLFINKKIKRDDVLDPSIIFLGTFFIGTSLRTLYILYDSNNSYELSLLFGIYSYENILHLGIFGVVTGFFTFILGYYYIPSKKAKTPILYGYKIISLKYNFIFIVFFSIAIVLIYFYLNAINFMSELSSKGVSAKRFVGDDRTVFGFYKIGSDIIAVLTIVHALYYYNIKRTKLNLIILIMLFSIAVIIPIIARTRGEIVYLLLSLLVIRHYSFKRLNIKSVMIFVIASFTIISVLGSIIKNKDEDASINFDFNSVVKNIIYAPHFLGVGKTSVIIASMPKEENFQYGKSYLTILVAPIPRTMWPEKPVIRIGRFVGKKLYNRDNWSGVPPGIVGESYLNFGWFGILIIPFILGVVIKKTYNKVIRRNNIDILKLGFYSIFIIFIMDIITTDLAGAVIRFLTYYIPFYIITRFSFKKLRHA